MATIRKGGKGWQALIRKKNHVGPLSKTFPTKSQAQLWADLVERSLQPPKRLTDTPPKIFKEAIEAYIEGPIKHHRSAPVGTVKLLFEPQYTRFRNLAA